MGKQREKNRAVIVKNQPYEYVITIIIHGELCKEGIIDIYDSDEKQCGNKFFKYI